VGSRGRCIPSPSAPHSACLDDCCLVSLSLLCQASLASWWYAFDAPVVRCSAQCLSMMHCAQWHQHPSSDLCCCHAGAVRFVTIPLTATEAASEDRRRNSVEQHTQTALLVATSRSSMRMFLPRTGEAMGERWMTPKTVEELLTCTVLQADGMPAIVCFQPPHVTAVILPLPWQMDAPGMSPGTSR
jgi:hypothetical protein